jgi:uncharacterized protein
MRLIAGLSLFGIASWAASEWILPRLGQLGSPATGESAILTMVVEQAKTSWEGILRRNWLAFAYIGAVLWLITQNARWLHRLRPFAWAGRMALSNYMLQAMLVSLLFQHHTLGLHLSFLVAPLCGLALAVAQAFFSRWWLCRYHYGPLEWLWRSMTYWSPQPFRLAAPVFAA